MGLGALDHKLPFDLAALRNATESNAVVAASGTNKPGMLLVIPIDIPDAATTTYSYTVNEKVEIIDVEVIKDGAGAANTIKLTDGADADISNAIAAAVDKTVTRAGTLDKAKRTIAAGGTFKIVATRAAGTMAAQVFIYCIARA
jgi:LysM repeat protein